MDVEKEMTEEGIAILRNHADLNATLRRIRGDLRRIEQAASRRDKAVAKIEAKENDRIAELERIVIQNAKAISAYAEPHKAELTGGGDSQSFSGLSGTLQWRKVTGIIALTLPEAECIAALERRRMHEFVRVKKSLKKDALRDKQELIVKKKIPGIGFKDGQIFTIHPAGDGGSVKCDVSDPGSWEINFPKKKSDSKSDGG
jgi:phage host-nuclease inhibitor protein Gam